MAETHKSNLAGKFPGNLLNYRPKKRDYIILFIAGVLILAIFNKSLFLAALVNGSPITNIELQMKLNEQFRSQILNQMINEKLILTEAAKVGTIPSDLEIERKIAELEGNVGGKETLDSLLTQQGQTRTNLKDQIKIQLAITKLYEKEATVSAEEITKFIEENRSQMRASDSAAQQVEAADILKQQKLSQIFNQKFQELRQSAKIQTF